MADRTATAVRMAKAQNRLRLVTDAAAREFGIPLRKGTVSARFPEVAAVELTDAVTDFIQALTEQRVQKKGRAS